MPVENIYSVHRHRSGGKDRIAVTRPSLDKRLNMRHRLVVAGSHQIQVRVPDQDRAGGRPLNGYARISLVWVGVAENWQPHILFRELGR